MWQQRNPTIYTTCTLLWSTWPDPNPAGRSCNHITEASCYFCSLLCQKPTIGLRNSCFSFFLSVFHSYYRPFMCANSQSAPSRVPLPCLFCSMPLRVGDCWSKSVIFKLTGKHLTWTQIMHFCFFPLPLIFWSMLIQSVAVKVQLRFTQFWTCPWLYSCQVRVFLLKQIELNSN